MPEPRKTVHVLQGQFQVSGDPQVELATVLGSCVAACLYDPVARVGGMNHFLLPGSDPGRSRNVKYGVHSMEQLINALLWRGADRCRLQAQLFGGANVVSGLGGIGTNNARFAREFLRDEHLPLLREDLGGHKGRRLRFHPSIGTVDVTAFAIGRAEMNQTKPAMSAPNSGSVELF